MSEFPGRPPVERGSLLVYETQNSTRPDQEIVFQYNPETLRRAFATRATPASPSRTGAAREAVLQVPGPPVETITATVVLDAADQVDDPAGGPGDNGLHPVLARLELLLYPSTAHAEDIQRQAQRGRVQVNAGKTPLVMLSWGKDRVVPVQLTSFSINEEAYDPELNPILARVELGMKVLTYVEFPDASPGRDAFISYQKRKEELARSGPGAGAGVGARP